jgi:hypothetical protein
MRIARSWTTIVCSRSKKNGSGDPLTITAACPAMASQRRPTSVPSRSGRQLPG